MMSFIEVTNLSKSYGSVLAVRDFSLKVKKGEIYALVGPDGAGKTTLMRTLCNLLEPDSGQAVINGHDIFKNFDAVKPILGYMPQQFSLYPDLSVKENLSFYAGLHDLIGKKFDERCDYLYNFSNLKPFSKRRASALSGGMKQKLALSCALLHDPQFLLLDEPTTGVDPLSRRQFWEILLTFRNMGVAIIVSTPYMDEVARVDRACFMFNGKKLSEGTPRELTGLFKGTVYHADVVPKADLVTQLNRINNISARRFGSGLHVYLKEGHEPVNYRQELNKAGLDHAVLEQIEPVLEDCFIQLLGGDNG